MNEYGWTWLTMFDITLQHSNTVMLFATLWHHDNGCDINYNIIKLSPCLNLILYVVHYQIATLIVTLISKLLHCDINWKHYKIVTLRTTLPHCDVNGKLVILGQYIDAMLTTTLASYSVN